MTLPALALEPDTIFPFMILICFFPTGVLDGVTACSLLATFDKDAGRKVGGRLAALAWLFGVSKAVSLLVDPPLS
jgi:hypothetical protein